jgi:hypothetical protein
MVWSPRNPSNWWRILTSRDCRSAAEPPLGGVERAHQVAFERVLLGHTVADVCYDCH